MRGQYQYHPLSPLSSLETHRNGSCEARYRQLRTMGREDGKQRTSKPQDWESNHEQGSIQRLLGHDRVSKRDRFRDEPVDGSEAPYQEPNRDQKEGVGEQGVNAEHEDYDDVVSAVKPDVSVPHIGKNDGYAPKVSSVVGDALSRDSHIRRSRDALYPSLVS